MMLLSLRQSCFSLLVGLFAVVPSVVVDVVNGEEVVVEDGSVPVPYVLSKPPSKSPAIETLKRYWLNYDDDNNNDKEEQELDKRDGLFMNMLRKQISPQSFIRRDTSRRKLQALTVDEVITMNSAYTASTASTYGVVVYAQGAESQVILQVSPDIGTGQSVSCTVSCSPTTTPTSEVAGRMNMKYGTVIEDVAQDTNGAQITGNQPTCPFSISNFENTGAPQPLYVGVTAADNPTSPTGTVIMPATSVSCTATPTPSPTIAPTSLAPTPAPTCSCFSEKATVQVQPPSIAPSIMPPKPIPMKDLKVGQNVLAGYSVDDGTPIYETVYGFGHRNETKEMNYIRIVLEEDIMDEHQFQPLEISSSHLIFVSHQKDPIRADELKVGHELLVVTTANNNNNNGTMFLTEDQPTTTTTTTNTNTRTTTRRIVDLECVVSRGVYEPLTKDGTIVVDGIEASTYVSIQELAPRLVQLGGKVFSDQRGAHWFVAPYRFVCTKIAPQLCVNDYSIEEEGINHWFTFGKNYIARYGEDLPTWLMAIYLVVVMSFFGTFLFLDNLLEGDVWSISTLVSVLAMYWLLRSSKRNLPTKGGSKTKVD